jgi:hypothetical protein
MAAAAAKSVITAMMMKGKDMVKAWERGSVGALATGVTVAASRQSAELQEIERQGRLSAESRYAGIVVVSYRKFKMVHVFHSA